MPPPQYQLPTWAKHPSYTNDTKWTLEEIKNGTVIQSHFLDGPVVTFGRVPFSSSYTSTNTTNDNIKSNIIACQSIVTAHESCSRLHARIAFDSHGIPWLRDLQSGNGTTVNKKKLPAKSIGKLEVSNHTNKEGARGVMIYPGDVIQFGASTRIYVLNGPSYFERGAIKARMQARQKQQKNQQQIQKNTEKDEKDGDGDERGVSWGMNFDVHHDENDNHEQQTISTMTSSSIHSTLSSSSSFHLHDNSQILPEKYQKLKTKIDAKQYKLQNLQNEMNRIQAKAATMELTTGQQSQLERNEKACQKLQEEINILEQELEMKLDNRTKNQSLGKSSRQQRRGKRMYDNNDEDYGEEDDCDFYDRTKRHKVHNENDDDNSENDENNDEYQTKATSKKYHNQAETMESLTIKWKTLLQKQASLQHKLQKIMSSQKEIQLEIKQKMAVNEECFFLQNDLQIVSDACLKVQKEEKTVSEEIESKEKMMLVIDNQIVFDHELLFIGYKNELIKMKQEEKHNDQLAKEEKKNTMLMPPPPPPTKASSMASLSSFQRNIDDVNHNLQPMLPPPPKAVNKDKIQCSVMPPPSPPPEHPQLPTTTTSTNANSIPKGPQRPSQSSSSILSTLQFLQQSSTSSSAIEFKSQAFQQQSKDEQKKKDNNEYNPKVDRWVKPKGQDGSGKTKLNAKFQGRY
jgi:pSer/pThr/pTyr-binding forkhead associated (FHA) protein